MHPRIRSGSHLQEPSLSPCKYSKSQGKVGGLLVPSILNKRCSPIYSTAASLFTGDRQNSTVKVEVQDPVTKVGPWEPQSRPPTPTDRISASKYSHGPFPSPTFYVSQGLEHGSGTDIVPTYEGGLSTNDVTLYLVHDLLCDSHLVPRALVLSLGLFL